MNRRLLTAGVVVGIGIGIGIGVAVAVGHRPDTSVTGSAAGTTSLGGAGLSVRPGEGAAALAANGFTPIAYPATCQGAVAAIASAEQVFPQLGAVKGVTDEQWRQTIERVYGQDNPTAAYYLGIVRRAADDAAIQRVAKDRLADLDTTTHPEWGGFRVVSCQPGKTATVEVLACLRQVADRHTACYADARQAGWDAGPGDWVIQQHQAPGDVAPPVLRERIDDETDTLAGSAPPARVRGDWLTALGAGWQEFSNAPK